MSKDKNNQESQKMADSLTRVVNKYKPQKLVSKTQDNQERAFAPVNELPQEEVTQKEPEKVVRAQKVMHNLYKQPSAELRTIGDEDYHQQDMALKQPEEQNKALNFGQLLTSINQGLQMANDVVTLVQGLYPNQHPNQPYAQQGSYAQNQQYPMQTNQYTPIGYAQNGQFEQVSPQYAPMNQLQNSRYNQSFAPINQQIEPNQQQYAAPINQYGQASQQFGNTNMEQNTSRDITQLRKGYEQVKNMYSSAKDLEVSSNSQANRLGTVAEEQPGISSQFKGKVSGQFERQALDQSGVKTSMQASKLDQIERSATKTFDKDIPVNAESKIVNSRKADSDDVEYPLAKVDNRLSQSAYSTAGNPLRSENPEKINLDMLRAPISSKKAQNDELSKKDAITRLGTINEAQEDNFRSKASKDIGTSSKNVTQKAGYTPIVTIATEEAEVETVKKGAVSDAMNTANNAINGAKQKALETVKDTQALVQNTANNLAKVVGGTVLIDSPRKPGFLNKLFSCGSPKKGKAKDSSLSPTKKKYIDQTPNQEVKDLTDESKYTDLIQKSVVKMNYVLETKSNIGIPLDRLAKINPKYVEKLGEIHQLSKQIWEENQVFSSQVADENGYPVKDSVDSLGGHISFGD